jgi:GNAT superfamily N-acetyltransferase
VYCPSSQSALVLIHVRSALVRRGLDARFCDRKGEAVLVTGLDAAERAGEEDANELLDLIAAVQPHVPWSHERFTWQYLSPPVGPARLYVARRDGRIVSLYAAVPQCLRTADGLVRAFMIQDVMTLPAYRGQGLLHQLGHACLADIAALGHVGYTFPNQQSERSFRRLGWTELGRVPFRSRPLETPARSEPASHTPAPSPDNFAERAAAIWADADVGVGVHRDARFLTWRYAKPNTAYDATIVGEDDAYLITKRYQQANETTVHICDLVARSDARRSVGEALAVAIDAARASGACRLTAWLPASHPYTGDFDAAGLRLAAGHDRFIFVTGPASGRWHVTQGDSDVY